MRCSKTIILLPFNLETGEGHEAHEGNGAHPRFTWRDLFNHGELLGASMDPIGITSRPPTLSCSINGGGTCPSAAVTTIASKGPHSNHP
jgi:hypothetical protein